VSPSGVPATETAIEKKLANGPRDVADRYHQRGDLYPEHLVLATVTIESISNTSNRCKVETLSSETSRRKRAVDALQRLLLGRVMSATYAGFGSARTWVVERDV